MIDLRNDNVLDIGNKSLSSTLRVGLSSYGRGLILVIWSSSSVHVNSKIKNDMTLDTQPSGPALY